MKSKARYNFEQFLIKQVYWWFPLLVVILFASFNLIFYWATESWYDFCGKSEVLVASVCSLSGFFIAVAGFILALNKNNDFTKKFFKSAHSSIFLKAAISGVLFAILAVLSFLFFDNEIFTISFDLVALAEVFILLYYIYYLFKQYISVKDEE